MISIIIVVGISLLVFGAVMWNFYATIDELERRLDKIEKAQKNID